MDQKQKKLFVQIVFGFFSIICIGILCGIAGYAIGSNESVSSSPVPPSKKGSFMIGVGRSDVTGPVSQVNMMGYAHPEQTAGGLFTRLYSRAYVISDATMTSRVVFVSVDFGMTSQIVKLRVVKELQEIFGNLYNERNIVISGTHTHSAPAGYFQYLLYEVTSKGTIAQVTDCYVNGIVESIVTAHNNMQEGDIHITSGDLHDANINRSPSAYLQNSESERAKYKFNTDHEMTVLRLDAVDGNPLGVVTWFPVHLTSMNRSNLLINADNKGRSSMLFERMMRKDGEHHTGKESFVAAFAQSNLGDVSPNTAGPRCLDTGSDCDFNTSTCPNEDGEPRAQNCVAFGPGSDMFESTDVIGTRQFQAASNLYHSPSMTKLNGIVSHAHQYVDMSQEEVKLNDGTIVKTCKPGLGYSFAAGCTDGTGAFDFRQGMTEGTLFWNQIIQIVIPLTCSDEPTDEYYECHQPKPVLFPTGYMDQPYTWHPSIVDVQLLRVGQLIIAAVPGEYSTMAGRRLREEIKRKAIQMGMTTEDTKVVIAGLSNVYTHYMVTYEEYQHQRYEAASTIFGPHTTEVYIKKYSNLVENLISGVQAEPGPYPEESRPDAFERLRPPFPDYVSPGISFGDVIEDVNDIYAPGDVVNVTFYGANPRHNVKLGGTYLEVMQLGEDGSWMTLFNDADWETKFIWNDVSKSRQHLDENVVTAVLNAITRSYGYEFDLDRARELYDKGELDKIPHYEDGVVVKGYQDALMASGVLKNYQPIRADEGTTESHVTIEWKIPRDQSSGTYRISYHGDYLSDDVVRSFTG